MNEMRACESWLELLVAWPLARPQGALAIASDGLSHGLSSLQPDQNLTIA